MPNKPNTKFGDKIFAQLPGFAISGKFVTQNISPQQLTQPKPVQAGDTIIQGLDESAVRNLAEEVFNSSTPSMIRKLSSKLPDIPDASKIYVLAAVKGEIVWLETESCEQ
jgi:hypothetical protein